MAEPVSTEVRDALVAANGDLMVACSRADTAGLAAAYTEGGQVLPPNSDVVTGKEAIQAFWRAIMDTGITGLQLETVEAEGDGNTAFEVGKFTLRDAEGQVIDTGKYVVIWKHESGHWKLHRDIFNSSRPAPGQ